PHTLSSSKVYRTIGLRLYSNIIRVSLSVIHFLRDVLIVFKRIHRLMVSRVGKSKIVNSSDFALISTPQSPDFFFRDLRSLVPKARSDIGQDSADFIIRKKSK